LDASSQRRWFKEFYVFLRVSLSGIVFAQQIGERLLKQRLDGAVGVRREVLDAAMILGRNHKRQAPLPGPRRGKVRFRRWSRLLGLNLWKGLGFEGVHAIGKTWSFLHSAAMPHCQQVELLSKRLIAGESRQARSQGMVKG
jgi:hypothetical protein